MKSSRPQGIKHGKFLFIFFCVCLAAVWIAWSVLSSRFAGADAFGKQHPIPEGLAFDLPLKSAFDQEPVDSLDDRTYLQLWEGLQGGIYEYDFYYPALPAGDICLRCFEATKEIPLSEDRLTEASKVSVDSTYFFSQLVDKKEFTIYEGEWGDYYAARIEVWFRDAQTGKERKLTEKVYRVEGWTR